MKNEPVLVFLHVPKAAGSTLHSILERQYPAEAMYRCDMQLPDAFKNLRDLPEKEKRRIRCLRGHLPFGLHELLPQPWTYITMLRHPVSRFISKYYYLRKTKGLVERLRIDPAALESIDAFIDLQIRRNAMNFQTRMISGCVDLLHPNPPYEPLPDNAVTLAKSHMDRYFRVIGIMERFDESLLLMQDAFGWRRLLRYESLNVNTGRQVREPHAADLLKRIQQLNAADMEIYEYAIALFDRRIHEAGRAFQWRLAAFRARNAVCSKLIGAAGRS